MPSAIALLLLAIAVMLGLADWLWAEKAGFALAGHAYLRLIAISGFCWLAGWFYETRRSEPRLAAMLTGTGFLVGFSAAASALNTMLLTVAGQRRNQERGTVARRDGTTPAGSPPMGSSFGTGI